ncbi:hypothetical protein A343_0004, partial [Porphyromonas gingivalis JCVI SC001]
YGLIIFLGLLFVLAFLEEGLWDITVWRERGQLFGNTVLNIPPMDKTILAFIVPLLALPQITHYILDGFIWRIKKDKIVL